MYAGRLLVTVLLTCLAAGDAAAKCWWDKSLQQIVCEGDGVPSTGSTGTNLLPAPPNLFADVEIPADLGRVDRELLRRALEQRRVGLEQFRLQVEQAPKDALIGAEYRNSIELYETGIERYRNALSDIK